MAPSRQKKSFRRFAPKLAKAIKRRREIKPIIKGKREREERAQKRVRQDEELEREEHEKQMARQAERDSTFLQNDADPELFDFGSIEEFPSDEELGSEPETESESDEDEVEEHTDDQQSPMETFEAIRSQLGNKPDLLLAIHYVESAALQLGCKRGGTTTSPIYGITPVVRFSNPSDVKKVLMVSTEHIAHHAAASLDDNRVDNKRLRSALKRYFALGARVVRHALELEDGTLAAHTMENLEVLLPHILSTGIEVRILVRTALGLGSLADPDHAAAGHSFLLRVAREVSGKRPLLQSGVFKGTFMAMMKAAHQYTAESAAIIRSWLALLTKVCQTNLDAAYQHAYVYIRQLAISLRSALSTRSPDSLRGVCNWQFVTALRAWCFVVSGNKTLHPLVHPLTQVATGVLELFTSSSMVPLQLHVLKAMNLLASRSGAFIPILPFVMRILTATQSDIASARRDAEEIDLRFQLRLKKSQEHSRSMLLSIWSEGLFILTDHLASNAHALAFPELVANVLTALRKFKRELKFPQITSQIAQFIHQIESNADIIRKERSVVSFGPCDIQQARQFEEQLKFGDKLPLVNYYNKLHDARLQEYLDITQKGKRKTLEEAVASAHKKEQSVDETWRMLEQIG